MAEHDLLVRGEHNMKWAFSGHGKKPPLPACHKRSGIAIQ
jgi:hypothetical protein